MYVGGGNLCGGGNVCGDVERLGARDLVSLPQHLGLGLGLGLG